MFFILIKRERIFIKTLSAVIIKEEEMYIASCQEVRTVCQGFTIEEAVENLEEVTELYLEEFPIYKNNNDSVGVEYL